jgi:hypothetical protein
MKTSSVLLILGVTGLLGLGCKKPVEPAQPKSPADCRIIATVYKTTIEGRESGPKYDLETITLSDGKTATISRVLNTSYKYDEQGRIVEVDERNPSGTYILERYTYLTNRVIRYKEIKFLNVDQVRVFRDTISLYPNGLLANYGNTSVSDLRYNQEGQYMGGGLSVNRPAGDSCRYENGNCVEKIQGPLWQFVSGQWIPTDYLLITYRYDLSRPNLRPFLQFMGNPSRNLPLTERWAKPATRTVYQKNYLYTFDQYDRVVRRIAHGKSLYVGWLIEDDYNGVGVTDYIYECP